jgi:hypothetical protein
MLQASRERRRACVACGRALGDPLDRYQQLVRTRTGALRTLAPLCRACYEQYPGPEAAREAASDRPRGAS